MLAVPWQLQGALCLVLLIYAAVGNVNLALFLVLDLSEGTRTRKHSLLWQWRTTVSFENLMALSRAT
jgi:hypothetical protein